MIKHAYDMIDIERIKTQFIDEDYETLNWAWVSILAMLAAWL